MQIARYPNVEKLAQKLCDKVGIAMANRNRFWIVCAANDTGKQAAELAGKRTDVFGDARWINCAPAFGNLCVR